MKLLPDQKKISLHIAFILPFMGLILFSAGLTSYLSFRNSQQAVNDMTRALRDEITARIEEHLQRYLNVPYLVNQSVFNALTLGTLDPQQPLLIGRSLCQQLQLFPELNSISLANAQGGTINAQRQEDGQVRLLMTQDFLPGENLVFAPDTRQGCKPLETLPTFDARQALWFQEAVAAQKLRWSPFYLIPYLPEPGFSLSQPLYADVQAKDKQLKGVVMTELRLSRLSDFMRSLNVGASGLTFIIQSNGLLVVSSEPVQPFSLSPDGNLMQREGLTSREPLIRATVQFLHQTYSDLQAIKERLQLDFPWQGELEFLQVTPYRDTFGLDWLIVVVLPEADFMLPVRANTRLTFWLSLGSLVLALLLSWQLSQAIIRPIRHLSKAAEKLMAEKWPLFLPDSHISEIQQLSNAFQHMSQQLRTAFITLEHKVDERTQALKNSLQALERSERALLESEAKYHALVEQIPVTVYEARLENRSQMRYISPQIEKLLGIPTEHWLQDTNTWINSLHKEDRGRVLAEYQNYLTFLRRLPMPSDEPFSSEYRMVRRDGEEIWISDYSLPVFDEKNQSLFLRGVMQDISERKKVEKELLSYRKHLEYLIKARTSALEDVNKQLKAEILERKRMEILEREYMEKLAHTSRISMLGEMAAQIAHQLNQPLAAIASYSVACKYLLQSFVSSDFAKTYQEKIQTTLEKINYEAQHAGQIIHRLRTLSRSNEMEKHSLNLNQLVEDAQKLIVVEAKWRGIQLVLQLAPQLPWVMADKVLLEQVILNLAHNAIAAMDELKDRARLLTIQTELMQHHEIHLRVIDTGPGLAEDLLEQVFTSFFTTKPHGIGLGLSICQSIVKAHEGRLWAQANTQGGTTFTLSLPACQDDSRRAEGMLYET